MLRLSHTYAAQLSSTNQHGPHLHPSVPLTAITQPSVCIYACTRRHCRPLHARRGLQYLTHPLTLAHTRSCCLENKRLLATDMCASFISGRAPGSKPAPALLWWMTNDHNNINHNNQAAALVRVNLQHSVFILCPFVPKSNQLPMMQHSPWRHWHRHRWPWSESAAKS